VREVRVEAEAEAEVEAEVESRRKTEEEEEAGDEEKKMNGGTAEWVKALARLRIEKKEGSDGRWSPKKMQRGKQDDRD
jgi:hypothetical protein